MNFYNPMIQNQTKNLSHLYPSSHQYSADVPFCKIKQEIHYQKNLLVIRTPTGLESSQFMKPFSGAGGGASPQVNGSGTKIFMKIFCMIGNGPTCYNIRYNCYGKNG